MPKPLKKKRHLQEMAEAFERLKVDAGALPDLQSRLAEGESKIRGLQEELTDTLRKRATLTEELLDAKRLIDQLQVGPGPPGIPSGQLLPDCRLSVQTTVANQATEIEFFRKRTHDLTQRVTELSEASRPPPLK